MPRGNPTTHSLSLLTPPEVLHDESLRHDWESLMCLGHPLNRVFASPTLYEHECRIAPLAENRVAVIRDVDRKVIGVCPIILWRLTIPFQVRKRVFAKITLNAATILSSEPLLPHDPALFQLLFDGLLDGLPWCDCVYINSMPADCFTAQFLYGADRRSRRYFLHPKKLESREWLFLELPESRESFLKEKKRDSREPLTRRRRGFANTAAAMSSASGSKPWTRSMRSTNRPCRSRSDPGRTSPSVGRWRRPPCTGSPFCSLAQAGCLRAYLLKCGGKSCAFVIGYQYQDVLQFEQTAYAAEFASFSPGSVLYYLMLEDLCEYRRPTLVNHGVGVSPHKQLFSNRKLFDTSVYLFRPTVRNRLRWPATACSMRR